MKHAESTWLCQSCMIPSPCHSGACWSFWLTRATCTTQKRLWRWFCGGYWGTLLQYWMEHCLPVAVGYLRFCGEWNGIRWKCLDAECSKSQPTPSPSSKHHCSWQMISAIILMDLRCKAIDGCWSAPTRPHHSQCSNCCLWIDGPLDTWAKKKPSKASFLTKQFSEILICSLWFLGNFDILPCCYIFYLKATNPSSSTRRTESLHLMMQLSTECDVITVGSTVMACQKSGSPCCTGGEIKKENDFPMVFSWAKHWNINCFFMLGHAAFGRVAPKAKM